MGKEKIDISSDWRGTPALIVIGVMAAVQLIEIIYLTLDYW